MSTDVAMQLTQSETCCDAPAKRKRETERERNRPTARTSRDPGGQDARALESETERARVTVALPIRWYTSRYSRSRSAKNKLHRAKASTSARRNPAE
jgi:hypothetical protein